MLCVVLQLPQNPLLILSVSPLVSIVNNVLGDQNYILYCKRKEFPFVNFAAFCTTAINNTKFVNVNTYCNKLYFSRAPCEEQTLSLAIDKVEQDVLQKPGLLVSVIVGMVKNKSN